MKKSIRIVCLVLVLSFVLTIPAYATEQEARASAFFSSYWTELYKVSSNTFQIWFDVNANAATMQKIGVSEIIVYRSSDQQNWIRMKTYDMDDYSEMICENTGSHTGYVTYDIATTGYYYTACVTFYAKNSSGVGEKIIYTPILQM